MAPEITGRYRLVEVTDKPNPQTYVGQMKVISKEGKTLTAKDAFAKRNANRINGSVQHADNTVVARAVDIAKANNWNTVYVTWFEVAVMSKSESSPWEIAWAQFPNNRTLKAGRDQDARIIRDPSPTYARLSESAKAKFTTVTEVNSLEEHFTAR
jgi:hypothetical protein